MFVVPRFHITMGKVVFYATDGDAFAFLRARRAGTALACLCAGRRCARGGAVFPRHVRKQGALCAVYGVSGDARLRQRHPRPSRPRRGGAEARGTGIFWNGRRERAGGRCASGDTVAARALPRQARLPLWPQHGFAGGARLCRALRSGACRPRGLRKPRLESRRALWPAAGARVWCAQRRPRTEQIFEGADLWAVLPRVQKGAEQVRLDLLGQGRGGRLRVRPPVRLHVYLQRLCFPLHADGTVLRQRCEGGQTVPAHPLHLRRGGRLPRRGQGLCAGRGDDARARLPGSGQPPLPRHAPRDPQRSGQRGRVSGRAGLA